MEKQQREEYDFFMRAAALFEQQAVELAPLSNSIVVAPIIRQAVEDAENARLWAERIVQGWQIVQPRD